MKTNNFRIILAVCLSLFAGTAISTKAQKAELVVQTGHSSNVLSVAFSTDGKTLASGSGDKTIKLWAVESGKELRTLKGHSSDVNSVSFSPDGKTLASGSNDKTIKFWNVETGKELRTLTGHSNSVASVSFSPDGKILASGSGFKAVMRSLSFGSTDDTAIKLWDVETGKEIRTLKGHSASVYSVAFSPDGKTLASGSGDNTIKLWDVESGKELRTLKGHSSGLNSISAVNSVSFNADGKTLASGSNDHTIKLWDVESGKELRTLTGHTNVVNSVSFSLDGKTLGSGSRDKTIKLWDVETGKELRTLTPRDNSVWGVYSVSLSSAGKTLASGSDYKTVKLWDVESGKELDAFTAHGTDVNSVSFSSDGQTLASGNTAYIVQSNEDYLARGSRSNTIKLWDVGSGKELRTLAGHLFRIHSVSFSSDGKTLASGSDNNTIKLWDVESGKELLTLTGHSDAYNLTGHSHDVDSVSFSPNGKTLASTAGNDNTIKLWDVESGKETRTLPGHSAVDSASFSPDGKILASGSVDYTIKLWDVESGKELRTLTGHTDAVDSVSFSPDGKTLASGSADHTIKVWDVETGKELRSLTGHSYVGYFLAFSSDGKTFASGSNDNTIKLWDVETGKELRTLTGHSGHVSSVSFSSDGKLVASGSADRKTKLWDVATGKEICSLIALDDNDWAVTTPDGRFDTNKIEDSQGIHWVVSDDPLKPIPLEIFMRDYFEPKLLPRLIKCNKEKNCYREFKPLPNIAELNRVQPPVKITNVSLPDANRRVKVTVEVGKGAVPQKECRMKRCETGAYDLRLFRDSQIVGTYPSDAEAELIRQSESLKTSITEKNLWRKVSGIKLEKTAGCKTASPECTTQTFEVELPRGKNAADIEFTAYAFNEDRVKTQTAKWEWPSDVIAKLPKAQPVKPRAYVIAVGVNAYENADFDLEFAADDARRMSEVVSAQLKAGGQYEQVVPVTLVSDYQTKNCQKVPTAKQATKDNFRAVLEVLGGNNTNRKLLDGVGNADQLQKATPDDLVLIMYSSHGYADRSGNFYFIPYDTGIGTGKVFTETVRQHSISSEELSLWLRDVDAGEMVMIVDACHSTAAIAGQDFKPGPMGSRGLGQLSYDKGMRILTATQSDNVAWEYPTLKQGVLTYALLRDGIEARQADHNKDNTITLAEWLAYGVDRVPKLYQEVLTNSVQTFGVKPAAQPKLTLTAKECGRAAGRKELEEVLVEQDNKSRATQQPSLFDFTRKKPEVVLSRYPPPSP